VIYIPYYNFNGMLEEILFSHNTSFDKVEREIAPATKPKISLKILSILN